MIIKQNYEIISVFMGKISCLHILQARDLFLPQNQTKQTKPRTKVQAESVMRAKHQQPLHNQDVFPAPSFHLPYALTDPGTGCTSSGTCDLQKQ